MEVSALDGPHILSYFYSPGELEEFSRRRIEPNRQGSPWLAIKLGTQEIIDRAEDYNCVTIAAHPYGYLLFNKGVQKCIEGNPQSLFRGDGRVGSLESITRVRLLDQRNRENRGDDFDPLYCGDVRKLHRPSS